MVGVTTKTVCEYPTGTNAVNVPFTRPKNVLFPEVDDALNDTKSKLGIEESFQPEAYVNSMFPPGRVTVAPIELAGDPDIDMPAGTIISNEFMGPSPDAVTRYEYEVISPATALSGSI
jgi:hypothetical protein